MDESQEEQVLLDENKEAEKHEFYMTGQLAVSPNNEMLAWAEDTTGNEMFTLHIKDIASGGNLLDKPIEVTNHKMPQYPVMQHQGHRLGGRALGRLSIPSMAALSRGQVGWCSPLWAGKHALRWQ